METPFQSNVTIKLTRGDRILRVGTALGMVMSTFLIYQGLYAGSVSGCGTSECDTLLSSRWGKVFLIPVSWFGFAFFTLWSFSEWKLKRQFRKWFAGLALGSVVWFILIQFCLLKQLCPACIAFHAVAIVVSSSAIYLQSNTWKHSGATAIATILCIGLAQIYGPEAKTHTVQRLNTAATTNDELRNEEQSPWERSGLKLSKELHPLIGSEEAPVMVVQVFDYQCMACRRVGGYFDHLLEDQPDDFGVILVLFPLSRNCNPALPAGTSDQPGACRIAKAALAVWRGKPEEFASFHQRLIKSSNQTTAENMAIKMLGRETYRKLIAELDEDDPISSNIEIWKNLSKGSSGRLPKLQINESLLLRSAPSSAKMFNHVMLGEAESRRQ